MHTRYAKLPVSPLRRLGRYSCIAVQTDSYLAQTAMVLTVSPESSGSTQPSHGTSGPPPNTGDPMARVCRRPHLATPLSVVTCAAGVVHVSTPPPDAWCVTFQLASTLVKCTVPPIGPFRCFRSWKSPALWARKSHPCRSVGEVTLITCHVKPPRNNSHR